MIEEIIIDKRIPTARQRFSNCIARAFRRNKKKTKMSRLRELHKSNTACNCNLYIFIIHIIIIMRNVYCYSRDSKWLLPRNLFVHTVIGADKNNIHQRIYE